jgi:hypothetical protein
MPLELELEQLIYLVIPIIAIIVAVYFLLIHKRRCLSCGRPVRPFWRECSCALEPLEPAPVFSSELEEEREEEPEIASTPEVRPFSYDDAQPLSEEGMGTEVMLPSISPASLLIEEWGMPEKRYEIKGAVTSIGTSVDNDIVLKDKAVSRHHAKIRVEAQKYFIYDLASTNGTKVNGRKITKKSIKEGDGIEIGHTRMTFTIEGLPSEMPKPKPSDLLKM